MKKGLKFFSISLLISVVFFLGILSFVYAASPTGAGLTPIKTETAPNDTAGNHSAYAGNVTEINVYGYSTTRSWQGYYGNVSGTIQLADASDNVLYNWSVASPRGQVYISTNSTIEWLYTSCFNFTAVGNHSTEDARAGSTSLFGTNLTQLEYMFRVTPVDDDGVDETFNAPTDANGHNEFYVGALNFTVGECRSSRIYDNTRQGVDNNFEEVLLYEPRTTSVIFTSILEQDQNGFDQRTHDFEALVLENGHGTDTDTTTYYFFVELQ